LILIKATIKIKFKIFTCFEKMYNLKKSKAYFICKNCTVEGQFLIVLISLECSVYSICHN